MGAGGRTIRVQQLADLRGSDLPRGDLTALQ